MNCENCKFWERSAQEPESMDEGFCFKKSPFVVGGQLFDKMPGFNPDEAVWPRTNENNWCGEFELKITKKKYNVPR